jgi:hypothetical protein
VGASLSAGCVTAIFGSHPSNDDEGDDPVYPIVEVVGAVGWWGPQTHIPVAIYPHTLSHRSIDPEPDPGCSVAPLEVGTTQTQSNVQEQVPSTSSPLQEFDESMKILESKLSHLAPSTSETQKAEQLPLEEFDESMKILESKFFHLAPSTSETQISAQLPIEEFDENMKILESKFSNLAPSTSKTQKSAQPGERDSASDGEELNQPGECVVSEVGAGIWEIRSDDIRSLLKTFSCY